MTLRRPFKNPWWVVFGSTLGLIVGNGPITFFTFGIFLKPITAEFGWNRGTVAIALTISHTVNAIATPFVGKMVDRWGVRRVTIPFIAAFALTTAAISLTTASPIVFILLYTACGLAGAGQAPLNYAKAICARFEARRGLALGIAMAGVGLGVSLVPQLARLLIRAFGWRFAYLGLGIVTFAIAIPAVALFIREPTDDAIDGQRRLTAADHSYNPLPIAEGMTASEAVKGTFQFWFILIALFLVGISVNGTVAHIVPILTDRGVSSLVATSLLSASGIALIAGRILNGYFLDRFFAPYVAACFFALPFAGIILLSIGTGIGVPLLGAVFLGLGVGSEIDVMAFLVGRYFGLRAFGQIYGYIMGVFVFAAGLGPTIMDVCFDLRHSYTLSLTGSCVALIVASLLISRLGPYTYPVAKAVVIS